MSEVSKYEDFLVFCYGGYERAFLKRMRKRAERIEQVDRVLAALTNVLSLVYAHVYFPVYSNGLKDVGACLGCSWTEPNASGIQSVVWRRRWEATRGEEWKQRIVTYNLEDCAALRRVAELVYTITANASSAVLPSPTGVEALPVVRVQELDRWANNRNWGRVNFFHPDYEHINGCAYFDYQRERVYVRNSRTLKKNQGRRAKATRLKLRVGNERVSGTHPERVSGTHLGVQNDRSGQERRT
jgi:hypothetical protein